MSIPESVLAIGRAGSGTNNIPVAAMSARGIPVFNAPGANANAVKELVLAGMLLAARNLDRALRYVGELDPDDPELEARIEAGKKTFAGYELAGHTLGVVGLGKIGCLVADAAIKLGMHVIGYDPEITVDSAWSLPASVKKAHSLGEMLKHSNFLSLHVPLVDATRGMIDAGGVAQMKPGAVVLNFSRERSGRRGRGAGGASRGSAVAVRLRLPGAAPARPARGDPAAAPGRLDRGGRGEQRGDGGRPGPRLPDRRDDPATRSTSRT